MGEEEKEETGRDGIVTDDTKRDGIITDDTERDGVLWGDSPKAEGAWPVEGATMRLAHGKEPPTVDGEVNVSMDHVIYLPSLEAQKEGFTPYKLVDGEPVDATRELMQQYGGTYKLIK